MLIVEKSVEFHKLLFLCMVDSVQLIEILREHAIPEDYIQAIVQLNKYNKTKKKHNKGFQQRYH